MKSGVSHDGHSICGRRREFVFEGLNIVFTRQLSESVNQFTVDQFPVSDERVEPVGAVALAELY
ncbi:hypothetical protein GCM10022278_35670 [Allohahella marinimesophila]|uniref:Uncharacterized protein n=1 Tax=Allohahella marinimesophila TaxID=1054972 RepID=A0ABP7Q331_9GAMM